MLYKRKKRIQRYLQSQLWVCKRTIIYRFLCSVLTLGSVVPCVCPSCAHPQERGTLFMSPCAPGSVVPCVCPSFAPGSMAPCVLGWRLGVVLGPADARVKPLWLSGLCPARMGCFRLACRLLVAAETRGHRCSLGNAFPICWLTQFPLSSPGSPLVIV